VKIPRRRARSRWRRWRRLAHRLAVAERAVDHTFTMSASRRIDRLGIAREAAR